MANLKIKKETNFGHELLLDLRGRKRRAQLEDRLRELIREGTLPAGSRLPSSRVLAGDLQVSRRMVVDAYDQLTAEGYLFCRPGAGTYVARIEGVGEDPPAETRQRSPRFDFFPGAPDLASFPRTLWLRVTREIFAQAPASAFAYPDAQGTLELRTALAEYLRRVRGVVADPGSIVICSGATQGLALIGRALQGQGIREIALEDPCLPPHRLVLSYAGLRVQGAPVDEQGVTIHGVSAPVLLCTPAHQCPTGVVLSPKRRAALVQWAAAGGLVIEDDYDAEFRYDRSPLRALQGLMPDRVIYLGSASKTLAPGLRLGWLVLPRSLLGPVLEAKFLDDLGSPTIDQLVLARLIQTAAYDRHLRKARRRNRARRDALIEAVTRSLPRASVSGISAGLHLLVGLPESIDAQQLIGRSRQHSIGIYPLSLHMMEPTERTDALVLGYAGLTESAIKQGIDGLADVLQGMGMRVR